MYVVGKDLSRLRLEEGQWAITREEMQMRGGVREKAGPPKDGDGGYWQSPNSFEMSFGGFLNVHEEPTVGEISALEV